MEIGLKLFKMVLSKGSSIKDVGSPLKCGRPQLKNPLTANVFLSFYGRLGL